MDFFLNFDLASFIQWAGYFGLFAIIFAESGLFIGFFLPGDSLLFTAGFLASQGYFEILLLAFLCFTAAVLGDSFGYAFGRKIGPRIFNRDDSIIFHKHHLEHARIFYERYGPTTVILARFLPAVRTFAPILAGVGNMRYSIFLFYNVLGGLFWAVGLTFLGYFLGRTVPGADRYIIPIVLAVIILSSLPPVLHVLKDAGLRRRLKDRLVGLKRHDST